MPAHPELLLRHLRALVPDPSAEQADDAELLGRFVRDNDEGAFASLVARHGAMVYGVCRRALRDAGAAEDVAQAAFLVLARKAKSIRQPESLPAWLHRTSRLLSLKFREADARRRERETQSLLSAPARTSVHPLDELSARELLTIFDEELQRLAERYRLPLILCCLEGCSQEEAARQLGWTPGSVKGRLERGRAILHGKLVRRGLSLSAALAGVEAVHGVSHSAGFVVNATRAALLFATGTGAYESGVAKAVVEIAEEGIRSAAMSRAKILLSLLLMLGTVTAGVAALARQGPAATPAAEKQASVAENPAKTPLARNDRYGDPLPAGALARLGTLRWRAPNFLQQLAYSPDGKTIAAASWNAVYLFDADGKITREFRSATTDYDLVAFSPNGKRLACSGTIGEGRTTAKRVVHIWELPAGHKPREFNAENLQWLGWSADGQPRAVFLKGGALLFRELDTAKERHLVAENIPDWPYGSLSLRCAFAPKANLLGLLHPNGVIHVWDVTTGKNRATIETNQQQLYRGFGNSLARDTPSLALSPDGSKLATAIHTRPTRAGDPMWKCTVQLWDVSTGKASHTLAAEQTWFSKVAFTPDSKTLVTLDDNDVRFYAVSTGRERARTKGETSFGENGLALSPDGKTLATIERNSGAIRLWDVGTVALKASHAGHANRTTRISFSPDGERAASTGGSDGSVIIWNPRTGEALIQARRSDWGQACYFSSDGRSLFICSRKDTVDILDAATGRVRGTLSLADPKEPDAHPRGLDMRLSDDGKTLVVFSFSGSTRRRGNGGEGLLITGWDMQTLKPIFRRLREVGRGLNLVTPDGKTLVFTPTILIPDGAFEYKQKQGALRLEDVATGEEFLRLPEIEGDNWQVAFSRSGRFLATRTVFPAYQEKEESPPVKRSFTIRLWELETAREALALPIKYADSVAFSPDGRLMAVSAAGQEIVVWDLKRGKERQRFGGFDSIVARLSFSPDSKLLISGLFNSTLLVWEVAQERKADKPAGLDAKGAEKAWTDLAGDARKAYVARGALALSPETALPLLKKHLTPVQPADPALVRRLLVELDGDNYAAREKARKELEELGDRVKTALQEALKKKPSLEAHRRIEALLERLKLPVTDAETLRSLRAVAVLEDIGTSEGRKTLEMLAKGSSDARLTREAKKTLERMARRSARGS